MNFSTLQGLTIPEGVVTQIADASGRVLWAVSGWPDDLDTGLEFASASPFTISVGIPNWTGTIEYCNGEGWKTWDGSTISSGETESGQCIYMRGTGNYHITGVSTSTYRWTLTGTDIECNGNIGNLLDYATVQTGVHPTVGGNCFSNMFYGCTALITAPSLPATSLQMNCYYNMFYGCTALITAPSLPATSLASSCYCNMFYGCTALITAPSLPATSLVSSCYSNMFRNCTSLTSIPRLPATVLVRGCYSYMFSGCTKIKLSKTATGTYTKTYRIPSSGTGKLDSYVTIGNAASDMFTDTGGTFTGTPSINTTYYLDSSNTIV